MYLKYAKYHSVFGGALAKKLRARREDDLRGWDGDNVKQVLPNKQQRKCTAHCTPANHVGGIPACIQKVWTFERSSSLCAQDVLRPRRTGKQNAVAPKGHSVLSCKCVSSVAWRRRRCSNHRPPVNPASPQSSQQGRRWFKNTAIRMVRRKRGSWRRWRSGNSRVFSINLINAPLNEALLLLWTHHTWQTAVIVDDATIHNSRQTKFPTEMHL